MHTNYFIVDFSYNPMSSQPLQIFELGDAFLSGLPSKKYGKEKISVSERFENYLLSQYPNALLLQAYPGGLNFFDFSSKQAILSNDNTDVFNASVDGYSNSYFEMIRLLREIIAHGEKRSAKSRMLIMNVSHPGVSDSFNEAYPEFSRFKFVNEGSRTLLKSFNNKKILHDFAENSPIYPSSIYVRLHQENLKDELMRFMEKNSAEFYVIKPIKGTRSEHVHVIPKKELLQTIEEISAKTKFEEAYYKFLHYGFLIQACQVSKPIYHKGKKYLGKGRAFIRADFDHNTLLPELTFILGYWQLAKTPMQVNVLNDDSVIANAQVNPDGLLEIEEEDWRAIRNLFSMHLPHIIKSIVEDKRYSQHLEQLTSINIVGEHDHFDTSPNSLLKEDISRQSNYSEVLNQFLKQQTLIPHGPLITQKLWYWWNTYIDGSSNAELLKKYIIDILGLDETLKKKITYNDQSIDQFVKDMTSIIESNNPNILSKKFTLRNKANNEMKSLFPSLALCTVLVLIFKPDIPKENFALAILFTFAIYFSFRMSTSLVQSHFFSKAEDVTPVERGLNNGEIFDYSTKFK